MQRFDFDSIDSTNEAAKRLIAESRIHDRALVVAREQSAGKGTRGRSWLSPRDAGLYMSVVEVLRDAPRPPATEYTLAAGIACVECLLERAGVRVQLKPVNDLYARGRKLGGILVETTIEHGLITSLVTGIGINLRRAERRLPPDVVAAVCLEELMPSPDFAALDWASLASDIASRVLDWNAVVAAGELGRVRAEWERHKLEDKETRRQGDKERG